MCLLVVNMLIYDTALLVMLRTVCYVLLMGRYSTFACR